MTGRMSNTAGNGTEAVGEAARDAFGNARQSIHDTSDAIRSAAQETVKEATRVGRQKAAQAADTAQDYAQTAWAYAREKPVQATLIGLGGLLLASMFFRRR